MSLRHAFLQGIALPLSSLLFGAALLRAEQIPLVQHNSGLPIIIAANATESDRFAAAELARYMAQITGKSFEIKEGGGIPEYAFVVGDEAQRLVPNLKEDSSYDSFSVRTLHHRVLLTGSTDRGTLYAVYELLERIGCRWFAPNFGFYGTARGEFVPHLVEPKIDSLDIRQRSSFRRRKLYIEEGQSHTVENLKQIVDWMGKARMNVLDSPIDYEHRGHTKWDNFRTELVPELRKRGITIEVGGHGYPNFLPQDKYFTQHPEWFGMIAGKRSPDTRVVFATSNEDAVRTYIENVKTYLRSHPEIDVFDSWPPDSAKWSEAPEDLALGSPSERQALLLNRLLAALKLEFPGLQVQFVAYSTYLTPPEKTRISPGVQMEFCPINRSFEDALSMSSAPVNREYYASLQNWASAVMDPADISIYSYITKYAWRSLPVVIPHLIADEIKTFHSLGIGGYSTYSEPGSWATFELDHYIVAKALWSSDIKVDSVLDDYARVRFGEAASPFVLNYFQLLEQTVPHAVGIPGTRLDPADQKILISQFEAAKSVLEEATKAAGEDTSALLLLKKLDHSRQYADNEMRLRGFLLNTSSVPRKGDLDRLQALINTKKNLLASSPEDGVILTDARNSQ